MQTCKAAEELKLVYVNSASQTLGNIICVCSEERAKRVSEARSERWAKSRHGVMLEQVKQQQQAAEQALEAADPDAPPQPTAPEERNLTLMIKADVQVHHANCHAVYMQQLQTWSCCLFQIASQQWTWKGLEFSS